MIEQIQGIAASQLTSTLGVKEAQASGSDFGQWLTDQIDGLNQKIAAGDMEVRKLALGQAGNIHEVMMRLEEAKIAFELAVQVRNRVVEAYSDVLRMQI